MRLLNVGFNIATENEKSKNLAELTNWDIIKSHSVEDENLADTREIVNINQNEFLEVSAETAHEFGQKQTAIIFRRKLKEIAPDDAGNLLKLAELFIENGDEAEAADIFAKIINDRLQNRDNRWKTVWAARKISALRPYLLGKTASAESELRDALEILFSPKIEIKTENPSSEFWFFIGITAEVRGQTDIAFQAFLNSNIADKDTNITAIFDTENIKQKLVRHYLNFGKLATAFELADADKSAKSDELLNLLTVAAENSGELLRAINYEKAKTLPDEKRIEMLQKLQVEKTRKVTDFTISTEKTRKLWR